MIRYLTINDIEGIQRISKTILDDVDFSNSMIDITEDGTINAFALSRKTALIDKFPKNKFPKNRANQGLFQIYTKENNHEIFSLYRRDRNGRALNTLIETLISSTKGQDIWWLDKESEFISTDNFNKLLCLINIKPTSIYFRRI
ncbi:MAG: hypothetical protein HUK02_08845 [Bacteroidaceae bacterium]|nr:hypothetical protein [Bacteroidaceae bacterium]